jgi:hypothetical protein
MVFARMTSRDGLRDITTRLNARPETLYHLGFTEPVAKSTLADANEARDWRIREDLAKSLMRKARPLYAGEDIGLDLNNTIHALDSTTIDLTLTLFPLGGLPADESRNQDAYPDRPAWLSRPASTLLEHAGTTWDGSTVSSSKQERSI